jgi:methionyl-tRNA formyltransferase
MKLGLLVSGDLGLEIFKKIRGLYQIVFVFTDKQSPEIVEYANLHSIPYFVGNPRNNSTSEFIKDKNIEVLVSVNYLYLIDSQLIKMPSKIAFNMHGSLLPKYRGRTPHVWSIINNESKTGITAHVIDSGCDTGPILKQITVDIGPEDTGSTILVRYKSLYFPLLQVVLNQIELGTHSFTVQDESLATYFGKRTPDDGRINWDWQKERIRNWVRAQSHPYPGAFSWNKNQKIIIDELVFVDRGYHYENPNGLVLSVNPLLIKTSNGVVELKQVRNFNHSLQVGDILY